MLTVESVSGLIFVVRTGVIAALLTGWRWCLSAEMVKSSVEAVRFLTFLLGVNM